MAPLTRFLPALGVFAAVGLTSLTGAATASAAPYCAAGSKADFARVQLFADANCRGGSMIIKGGSEGDRPNFARFTNYDGRVYNVDNSRSSAAVANGTCIRVFDGAGYTGEQSNILCATNGTGHFGFFAFNNRASSIRVCAVSRQARCARDGGGGAPTPTPSPNPTPSPSPTPGAGGFPRDVTSAPDTARYDDAGAWKSCTSGFTRGSKRLQAWLRASYGPATIGGFNCRPNTADPSKTSIHGVGRANDWFRDVNSPKHRGQVAGFIRRMTANGAAQARAMGIQYWIWNKKQYSVRGRSVLVRPYGGPSPHTDHVHIEMNLKGARLQTSYWKLPGAAG